MCATCGCAPASNDNHQLQPHEHKHEHGHEHQHEHAHLPEPALRAPRVLRLEHDLIAKNSRRAAENRHFLSTHDILALNLTSSPGSGKTTLLERTILHLAPELDVTVIEGDQETQRDADRIRAAGCRAVQINTGAGCHLDADMVAAGIAHLEPTPGSLLLIENVGNLVCPALFDLGEEAKVVVMSVTEGDDKPLKYPHMFRAASLLVLSKIDLLPYVDLDVDRCVAHARRVNPRLEVIALSAKTGDGLGSWIAWLRARLPRAHRSA